MTADDHPVVPAPTYCGGCGATIEHSAKFCRSCGVDQERFVDPSPANPVGSYGASNSVERPQAAVQPPPASTASVGATSSSTAGVGPPKSPTAARNSTRNLAPSSPAGPKRGSVLTAPWRTTTGHRRSVAWIYYALITVVAVIVGFHHPETLLVAAVTGLYSSYLFRGGSLVIWFW